MKDKRKKANNVINRPKRYVKGTQKANIAILLSYSKSSVVS